MAIFGHTLYIVVDKYGNTVFTNRENVIAYPVESDARAQALHMDGKDGYSAPHRVIAMDRVP